MKKRLTIITIIFVLVGAAAVSFVLYSKFKKPTKVLLIGNSLTHYGKIPQKFEEIAKIKNRKVEIKEKTDGGYRHSMQANDVDSSYFFKKNLQEADVVIFQEYGTEFVTTKESIKEMLKYCKKGVKIYFLLTDWDSKDKMRVQELSDIKGLKFIPAGQFHDEMIYSSNPLFKYDDLHMPDDYHPNGFYGYLEALCVYSVLYNDSCIGIGYDFLSDEEKDLIPGKNYKEKKEVIEKAQKIIMKTIKEYKY